MDHPHSLQMKPAGAPYMCSGCRELGFESSYRCEKSNCTYVLHDVCANPVPHAFHRFMENSYFEWYEKAPGHKPRYCDACGMDVLGFVYHCSRTGYDLHPCCLKLKDIISDDEGGHVTLKLSQNIPSKCVKCNHRNVVNNVKGWSYVSSDGNTCYHVSCFKDLILEIWKRGYFSQETSSSTSMHDRESQLALTSMEIGLRRSRRLRTINKYTKIAVVVFKLIFSAIFGNPISAIAALLEVLASD